MKLKKEFIAHNAGGETVLVPTAKAKFSGVVRGNESLGMMLAMLKKDTSEQAMVKAIRSKYEADQGVVEKDVRRLITELRKIGALDE